MKKFDLLQFTGKADGQKFHAEDWNSFVENIANIKAMKVEQRSVSNDVLSDWTDITENITDGQLQAGGIYRLSGYFPYPL